MAKPDPALLDPARYPFHCEMATRFGDLDTNMHLNNVALAGIIEDGRVRFHRASSFHTNVSSPGAMTGTSTGMTTMVASFAIEYLGQAFYPQPLDMHVAVSHVGRTSFSLCQLLLQEGRIVSFAQSVMVCITENRPTAIPALFLDGVAGWMLRA